MQPKRTTPRVCERCGTDFLAASYFVSRGGGRFCSRRCATSARHEIAPRTSIETRFWSRVDRSGACWLWRGGTSNGYGAFSIDRRPIGAHVYSWILHNGPVPKGMVVCHDCPGGDNRLCVNPAHLFLGSYSENLTDWHKKGEGVAPKLPGNTRRRIPRNCAWCGDAFLPFYNGAPTRHCSRACANKSRIKRPS